MEDQHPSSEQRPGAWEQVKQFVEDDRKKWGGMSLDAHARLGLSELREAFSLGGNIEQPTPYGMYGTLTPGEVAAERSDHPYGSSPVQQMEQEPLAMRGENRSLPSPGEIAADSQPYSPDQDQGHEHGQEHGRSR